jgi:UDP-N-acetylmuramoylalanine--D-glutamate ligase
LRVLGKGKTALAIKEKFIDISLYDDSDKNIYDKHSDELTIISPGIPPYNDLVKQTKNKISEYDFFSDMFPYTIWISGTNGKTTTTQMLQHLLKDKGSICGGNIGTPLAIMDTNKPIWILETSSFTLHYTKKAKPNLYILLPISEDHISWHGSFEEYEKAKLKPLDNLKEGEIALIPYKYRDYPTNGYKICYKNIDDFEKYFNIDVKKVYFKEPFLLDALLSLSISKILFDEIDYKKINSFIQDPHKLEEFEDKYGRLWIDDSKATNIDATIQALKNYKDKKIYLILGGDDKGADLNPLFKELKYYDIEIFAIGINSEIIINLSKQYDIKSILSKNLKNAVYEISMKLKAINTNIALLSPSAASLDQFKSYKHRGKEFKKNVKDL